MRDVFTLITEQVLRDSGGEPICAHVGDVQVCAIKSHPTYQVLRDKVRLGRSKSVASLRLWESVCTLARESNHQEREKWLMILLDLLTPYFGGWSKELARKWHYEVSDIRSAMVEGTLEAWFSMTGGTPSKKLLDTMMTRAFTGARGLVEAGSSETCAASAEYLIADAVQKEDSTLLASSIIDVGTVQDPDANERIRGERTGALLQRMGAMDHAKILHDKLRSGRRDEADAPCITPAQVGRSWVDGKNLYYRISDILPQYIGFSEAANTIGLSESQASRMARKGSLPFRVLWIGNSRVVSVKSLMLILDIQDSIVHPDDVENGASHVGGE
ncbi:hypothetical protein GCM10022403_032780 [Streptomyces coacervatus]|uniref:DNA-binding protein n=1 Tax=Streptomyces coacervatus TaxID=647381 RepID=A0ABP7HLC3_9ACTN|nr:hypothetical protein [Streptomyces coacervatus]MDF2272386.1 hypothetical protein [Streptomyces coacervatus]